MLYLCIGSISNRSHAFETFVTFVSKLPAKVWPFRACIVVPWVTIALAFEAPLNLWFEFYSKIRVPDSQPWGCQFACSIRGHINRFDLRTPAHCSFVEDLGAHWGSYSRLDCPWDFFFRVSYLNLDGVRQSGAGCTVSNCLCYRSCYLFQVFCFSC